MEVSEISKIYQPQTANKTSKVLTLSNTNIRVKKKNHTECSEYSSETPIKLSHINRLNCSGVSDSSNKSKE